VAALTSHSTHIGESRTEEGGHLSARGLSRRKHSGARAPLREATERSRWVRGENEDARRTQLSEGGIQTSPLKRRPRTSSAPTPCFLAVAM